MLAIDLTKEEFSEFQQVLFHQHFLVVECLILLLLVTKWMAHLLSSRYRLEDLKESG